MTIEPKSGARPGLPTPSLSPRLHEKAKVGVPHLDGIRQEAARAGTPTSGWMQLKRSRWRPAADRVVADDSVGALKGSLLLVEQVPTVQGLDLRWRNDSRTGGRNVGTRTWV
jgi:hypothetical protein